MTLAYSTLLDRVFFVNGLETKSDRLAYLRSLESVCTRLSGSYSSQRVTVDYAASDVQEAYLLRYYLAYSFLLGEVLSKTGANFDGTTDEIAATFFGCGPGPELLGLMRFLKSHDVEAHLVAWMFDKASSTWSHARDIVEQSMLPQAWPESHFELNTRELDISDPAFLSRSVVKNALRASRIVVFQNCLNEIGSSRAALAALQRTAGLLAKDSTLVVIDRAGYPQVVEVLRALFSWAQQQPILSARAQVDSVAVFDARALKREIMATEAGSLFGDTDWHYERKLLLSPEVKYWWLAITRC